MEYMFNVHNSRKRKKYLTYKICASYYIIYMGEILELWKCNFKVVLYKIDTLSTVNKACDEGK